MALRLMNFRYQPIYMKNIFNTRINLFSSTNAEPMHKDDQNVSSPNLSKKFQGYQVVYMNPYAKHMNMINKLKYWQSIGCVALVGITPLLEISGYVPENMTWLIAVTGIFLNLWIYQAGILTNDAIGLVYYHKEEKKIILSYSTFWGRREDVKVSVKEIYHLHDLPTSMMDKLYKKVKIQSYPKQLKLLNAGKILNEDQFTEIFGARK